MLIALAAAFAAPLPPLPQPVCGFGASTVGPPLELRLVGTDTVFASASSFGGAPTLTGTLGRGETGAAVLRAELVGSGLRIQADIPDAMEIGRPTTTKHVVLLDGLDVPVSGFAGERVEVGVAGQDIKPARPLVVRVACDALRVRGFGEPGRYWPQRAGLALTARIVAEPRVLRDAPGGRVVARGNGEPMDAGVLETRGAWVYVAVHDEDMVWLGWIPEKELYQGGFLGSSGVGGLGASAPQGYQACPDAFPLVWRDDAGHDTVVGEVDAGTPFIVGEAVSGGVLVSFNRRWLSGRFVLPAAAASCPAVPGPP